MNVRIVLADNEPIGLALKRFKKLVKRSGITYEMRRRKVYYKPTHKRRSKEFKRRFKAREATLIAQQAGEQPTASVAESLRSFWKVRGKP